MLREWIKNLAERRNQTKVGLKERTLLEAAELDT